MVKLKLEVTTFCINVSMTKANDNFIGDMTGINTNAAVTFFLGVMKITMVRMRIEHFLSHIGLLCFKLLQADKIGILFEHPR